MRIKRTVWTILLSSGLVLGAPAATASSVYPGAMQSHLSASSTPACTVCHTTLAGGTGTATRSFAQTMKGFGLVGNSSTSSLNSALDRDKAAQSDSDHDCVDDITELSTGKDPSNGSDESGATCTVGGGDGGTAGDGGSSSSGGQAAVPLTEYYGCSTTPGSGASGDLGAFGAAGIAVLGALAARRRRRR